MEKAIKDINSYEKAIQTTGLGSLSIDEIEDYRTLLVNKKKALKRDSKLVRIMEIASGVGAAISGYTATILSRQYFIKPTNGIEQYVVVPSILLLGGIFGALCGATMQIRENNNKKREDTDKTLNLVDTEREIRRSL